MGGIEIHNKFSFRPLHCVVRGSELGYNPRPLTKATR
jgi:hypothetical protein